MCLARRALMPRMTLVPPPEAVCSLPYTSCLVNLSLTFLPQITEQQKKAWESGRLLRLLPGDEGYNVWRMALKAYRNCLQACVIDEFVTQNAFNQFFAEFPVYVDSV